MPAQASARGTYLVIAQSLRRQVDDGAFGEGSLPSEADLSQTHQVSRNTVRRALKQLEADSVIVSVPGSGWRVAQGFDRRPLIQRMMALISDEALAIGDAYPSESRLCERFGASRTAVRRALAQMEGSGLLDTVHGKGRRVCALPASPAES
ncbi:winged helix-turn-helix domain-containing protein [Streptomyces sp. NPDC002122]|uniref:winged helix-turn-helix domain-containing protein n=1 Tax=Streptomyces sp. NPDC002122 TaxID=3154407 RepID=UPI00332E9213